MVYLGSNDWYPTNLYGGTLGNRDSKRFTPYQIVMIEGVEPCIERMQESQQSGNTIDFTLVSGAIVPVVIKDVIGNEEDGVSFNGYAFPPSRWSCGYRVTGTLKQLVVEHLDSIAPF